MRPIGESQPQTEVINTEANIVALSWTDVWRVELGENETATAVANLAVVTGAGASLKVGQTSARGCCRRRLGEAAAGLSSVADSALAVDILGLNSRFVVSANDMVLQITATNNITATVAGTVTRL